jgi:hypothetical protein
MRNHGDTTVLPAYLRNALSNSRLDISGRLAVMTDLADFGRIAATDRGLCVAISTRADGSAQASVVNAGIIDHPVSGRPAVALVAAGGSRKLANWRQHAHATLVVKTGWEWCAIEGAVDIIGPDDARAKFDSEQVRLLLRAIFVAAGGAHDDWDEYDRVMASERRAAVVVTVERAYSN